MIEFMLGTPNFYFSYSYDLTHTLQRLHNTTPEYLQVRCKPIVFLAHKLICLH
jgi:SacI homology domain